MIFLNSFYSHTGGCCSVMVDNPQQKLSSTDIYESVDGLGMDFCRTILQTQPVGTVVFDSSLQVIWRNRSAISLTGSELRDIAEDLGQFCQAGQTVNWAGVLTESPPPGSKS